MGLALLLTNAAYSQTARVQAVHNSADAAIEVVDVYLGDIRIIDDIGYKVATPFLDAPAGIPLTFTVAPGDSNSVADGFYSSTITLEEGMAYIFVADGIYSQTGYSVAPNFSLEVYEGAFEDGFMEGYTSILVHHGSTDAGGLTVSETGVPLGMFLYDMPYPQFTLGYFNLPTMDYVIEVKKTSDDSIVGSYNAPFATLGMEGQSAMIVGSGFLNPENNSNGQPFGLFIVPVQGGYFIPLTNTMGTSQPTASQVVAYPNPAADFINLQLPDGYGTLETVLYDLAGREVYRSKDTARIDVSGLHNGVYLLHAAVDGQLFTHKITISK